MSAGARPDFWLTSGYHLLQRDAAGRLAVTDAYLQAYLARPEIAPVPESCAAERDLHRALTARPRQAVDAAQLDALQDPDARDNYRVLLGFRDLLLSAGSLEAAYQSVFRQGGTPLPPQFLDQMAHAILRNILDACEDPLQARAAELLYRSQKVSLQDGRIMVADEEIVEMHAARGGAPSLLALAEQRREPGSVELDVLDRANGALYWPRSDCFDTVLEVGFTRPGLDALCRVLEAWIRHFTATVVRISPVQSIRDERWAWHVGLDAEASAMLNELWEGRALDEARMQRLLSLFRLEFADPRAMLPRIAGRPVYLAMAMTPEGRLRLKPQNLLVNLPLAPAS